jgi:nucleotide-binding universal stress UspA family protein
VAHHLTHHTTLPLAIVPPSGSSAVRHLVLGVDGSDGSLSAARACADMAAGLSVGVTAVHAFEPVVEWVPEDDPRSWHTAVERRLREWTEPLRERGVEVELDIDRDSHPVDAIARALAAHAGSAAIVGTRGAGGFSGLRLGRVPLQLVHHTGAAVVMVPAGSAG